MRVGVLGCFLLAGCFTPSPTQNAPCAANGECPDGLRCNADNKCVKSDDLPDASSLVDACPTNACVGDMLVGCDTSVTCTNGCGGATPHCLQLSPSNGLNAGMLMGATADINIDKLNFDAGDGSIRMMNNDIRLAGTGVKAGIRWEVVNGVSVWTANTWMLGPGRDWTFSGTRPVTLFANTSITIASPLLVNATTSIGVLGGTNSNTGTAAGCSGRAGRNIDGTHAEGGGGGGGGNNAKGGDGGPSNQGGTFTGIGGQCATRPTTIPLVGGNGGGASGASAGGGGGGAISLVSMETITITSAVSASGAGGGVASTNGGGGGGGGGAIFIEAPNVIISGQLTANGGGGGSPGGQAEGNDGTTSTANTAAGGSYTGSGGPAKGGNGGAGITNPQAGTSYNFDDTVNLVNYNRGGGGGGAFGVIEVKRKTGGVSGIASPAATITNAVFE